MDPSTGIWLHPQEYGILLQECGSSYRNMGFFYRNVVLPTQICCCCSVTKSYLTLCDSMDYSMPGSIGFCRQGYWSRLPFPSPRIFSDQGLNTSPSLAGGFFTTEPPGNSYRNRALLIAQGSALALLTDSAATSLRHNGASIRHTAHVPPLLSVSLRKLLPLSVGWIWWLASNEESRAKGMKCHVWD